MEGKQGQTERATSKRREKSRQKGTLPISQEVLSVAVLFTSAIMLRLSFPEYLTATRRTLEFCLLYTSPGEHWSGIWVQEMYWRGMTSIITVLTPLIGTVMLVGVAASMGQTGPYFSWGALKMGGLKALNPVKGAKKLFSLQSISKLWLTLAKIFIICLMIWAVWDGQWHTVAQLPTFELAPGLVWVAHRLFLTVITVCIFAIVVAVIDTIMTRRRHERDMMMTKHEVKDERKQYEPNPQVKKAQFRKMRELTMSRLVAAVPDATVVVTNPTHVSVALKYDPDKMDAPKVVAKGMRLRALRIRELARKHNVPIVERPAMARTLYASVKVGRSIPASLFGGVAEVLAYLHRTGHRLQGVTPSATEKSQPSPSLPPERNIAHA